jgi:putative transcriptional regulator
MVDVKAARKNLQMSQDEFAAVLRIPVSTLRKWEQGQRSPDAATRLLLQVIVHEPKAVEKTLAAVAREGGGGTVRSGRRSPRRRPATVRGRRAAS